MSMTRSKAQVLRGFLPGQTFEHPDDIIARVRWVDTGTSGVDPEILFANLERKLQRWQQAEDPVTGQTVNRASGFADLTRFRNDYALVEPINEVRYGVWPLILRCISGSCEKAVEFRTAADFLKAKSAHKCDVCGSPREQMPYIQVHHCGKDETLLMPRCDRHGDKHVYLKDEGSFETSSWRCRAEGCGGRFLENMRFRPCGCGLPGGFVSRTVRQEDRFITHTLSFVSFQRAPRMKLMGTPDADKIVIGYWLGLIKDYEQALADAANTSVPTVDLQKWQAIEPMMRSQVEAGVISSEDFENMRRRILGETEDAFGAITDIVPPEICSRVGGAPGAHERTLIWGDAGGLRKWRLPDFRKAAADTGRHGAVDVLDDAERELRRFGFSDLIVVENFPVALVAYGYSRLSRTPQRAQLLAFPPKSISSAKDKVPIFVIESNTEAVFFELDARQILAWLSDQNLAPDVELPEDDDQALVQAKAAVLSAMNADPVAAARVQLLQHTMAHALIRNLGERAGFAENTMAEYHIPELLTFGVYADTHQDFTLGALVSLVEHRLAEWLEAAKEGARSCDWDPKCSRDEGACMGCLHLSFGCDQFNEGLDRATLFGAPEGHTPAIERGFWA